MVKSNHKTFCVADLIQSGEESTADLVPLFEKLGPGAAMGMIIEVTNGAKMACDIAARADIPGGVTTTGLNLIGLGLVIREMKKLYEAKHGPVDWDREIAKHKSDMKAKARVHETN